MSDSPIELVLSKLPTAKPNGDGWLACCPAHEDRSPSLSINEGDDGRVLLKCFAGCSHDAIVGALGLQVSDLFVPKPSRNGTHHANGKATSKPKSQPASNGARCKTASAAVSALMKQQGSPAGQWTYHDANGQPVALVLRFNKPDGSKEFRPVSLHDDGGWYLKAPATPRPLYGLPDLATASVVHVCEGEKAADAARSIGLIATTSMNGSQSPDKSDWSPLVGKTVVILPDNDEAGRKYADAVAEILHRLDSSTVVKIIELPGLPQKGDVVEWIEAHGDAAEPEAMRDELLKLVASVDVVEPEPPMSDLNRFEPFPVDSLPEPVRSFVVEGARSIGCDPCYVALPMLAVLSGAVGNSRHLTIKQGWSVPPTLWIAIIGLSGTAKSPAQRLNKRMLSQAHKKTIKENAALMAKYESDLLRHEVAVNLWKKDSGIGEPPEKPGMPPLKRFLIEDATIEALCPILADNPRGLLAVFDELDGWFGAFDRYASGAGSDAARWLSLYNSESFVVDRKTGHPRTIYVNDNSVSLCGGIQPSVLKSALSLKHRSSGLAARLLLASPPRSQKRWTEAVIDDAVSARMQVVVNRLFELEMVLHEDDEWPSPQFVGMSSEAKKLFIAYYNKHNAEQVELDEDLSAAWSKLEEVAARLALVVHCVRGAAEEPDLPVAVDAESMKRAITITEWFKHEARRVYAMLDETEGDTEQRKLVEWIGQKGGSVTARELQRGPRQYRIADIAEKALDDLAQAGLGYWSPIPTGASGGRASRMLTLATATKPRESS